MVCAWNRCTAVAPLLFSLLCFAGEEVPAQQRSASNLYEVPSLQAIRLEESESLELRIDGLLSESAWQRAPIAGGFRQREPFEGAPATEATEVRVLYDDQALYIGVIARDQAPDRILSRILQRDRVMDGGGFGGSLAFAGDDGVAILLDPFHDHRNGVVFATNPNGAEFDALITDEGIEINVDWRGIWEVRAARLPDGWSAEFAIPFRTLRYPASKSADEPWGFNVYRVIRHKNEEVLWSSWSRNNEGFGRVSRAGHLYGMIDLPRPGMNMEVKPYALSEATQARNNFADLDADGRFDAGVDVKWEVRPGLTLDLTANTDFAQVEVDDQQVNLTRFRLFFPEKRDFFLENAGVFEFGYRSFFEPPPFILFFSRRIGLNDSGAEIPVLGGARLTGRLGRQTLGLINLVTDSELGEPVTNYAVARYKRDIGNNNYLGAIVTNKSSSELSNTTGGIDFSYWPTRRLNFRGYLAGTSVNNSRGEDLSYHLLIDFTANHYGYFVQHFMIGDSATAETGFVTRTGIRRSDLFFRVTPRPQLLGLRLINIFFSGRYLTRLDGEPQDWNAGVTLELGWNSGDNFSIAYTPAWERLDAGFTLAGRLPVERGDYDADQFNLSFNSSRNRPLSLNTSYYQQKFYDGMFYSVSNRLNWAVNAHMAVSLGYTYNHVDLDRGSITPDIGILRLAYAFSTRLSTNLLLQYNRLENTVSTNFRLNYIHRPGSDIFLVINDHRGDHESLWDIQRRGAVFKVTYLRRL